MIECIMQNRDGSETFLRYDPTQHRLWEHDKEIKPECYSSSHDSAPATELRISMGRKCNFSCTYCSQHMCTASDPVSMNTEDLVLELLRVTRGKIRNIQLWGGEPLLYFERIKELYGLFEKHMQGQVPTFHITTNGSLLYGKKLEWLMEKRFSISISWDGAGQFLRGPEIFDNPQIKEGLKKLYAVQPERVALSPVLTNASWDYADLLKKVEDLIGPSTISLCESRCLTIVDECSKKVAIAEENLIRFSQNNHDFLLTNPNASQHLAVFANNAADFIKTLGTGTIPYGPRCFVGKPETLTVDMAGNILTCQNFDATAVDESGEAHCLGHIQDMLEITPPNHRTIPPTTRLTQRQQEKCQHCVVFAICKGGCPYSPAEYDDLNCKGYYHQFLPVFGLALHKLTGAILREVRPVSGEER